MEILSTAGMPSAGRMAAWNDLYSSRLAQVEFQPADRDTFKAELKLGRLGPISVARMTADRSSIDRTSRHIRFSSNRIYTFLLQAQGRGVFAHCGHEAVLEQGDFALCDSAAPHTYAVDDRSETIMLRVPANVMKSYFPSPEQLCGRHLRSGESLAHTAGAMARGLCQQVEIGFAMEHENCAARLLMDMMSSCYAMAFDPVMSGSSSIMSARYAEVKRSIEERLRDPDLSPCLVATGLRMSSRYIRMIFAAHNDSVSAYMLRRRLEETARQIRDPRWRGHTITEIAFSWGFNSAAHFARSFRERYGVAARDYRRMKLD